MKEKTFITSPDNPAEEIVPDLVKFGNPDMFKLICKASSQEEGWMKSTKAMEIMKGVVIQVTTQQRNPDGSYSLAEALTFVPGGSMAHDGDDWSII